MSKKPRFRRSFKKQHGKIAQTLLKYESQYLFHIYWLQLEKVCVSAMQNLKTVFNTLTADDKYSLLNKDNLRQPILMELCRE